MSTKRLLIYAVILIVVVVVYGSFNPETSSFFPQCPFRLLTGYECPGCGSQRAVYHLLNGRIGSAFQSNALLVLSIPYILLLVLSDLLKRKSLTFKRIYQVVYSPTAIWVVFVVVIGWWVGRIYYKV